MRDAGPAVDWAARVREALFAAGAAPDDDVVEELAQHAAARCETLRAEGASAQEAAAKVGAELLTAWRAEAGSLRHACRRAAAVPAPPTGGAWLDGLGQDVRYAFRLLARAPGHTALTLSTLATGIGIVTLLASLVHGVLLQPLPWADSERVVRFAETREGATRTWPWMFTNASYHQWQERHETLELMAAYDGGGDTPVMEHGGEATRVEIMAVTASLFELLRARPGLGHVFTAADEEPGGVVVLSHALWTRAFGADPRALGRSLKLDGTPHRIVGVMPASFAFPGPETQAWTPLRVPPLTGPGEGQVNLALFSALARLKPGVSPEQAAAEGTARGRAAPNAGMVTQALFGGSGALHVSATPVLESITAEVRPALLLLLGAGALLLATATANVASLQLARATARRREIAVRGALGAGTGRIARQLVVESLLLSCAGGALGLLLAAALHGALPKLLPDGFPRALELSLGLPAAAFAFGVALLAGLAFALLPALMARRLDVARVLADDSAGSVGAGRSGVARARALILTGQVAVASLLLVGAIQLGRSLMALMTTELGFQPANVLVATLPMPAPAWTPTRRAQVLDAALERLSALPGVSRASFSSIAPLSASEAMASFVMPARTPGGDSVQANASMRTVSRGYFEALGRPIVSGRGFDERDVVGASPALIVNRTFAQRYLGPRGLGQVVPVGADQRRDWVVVGVVEDSRQRGPLDPVQPEVFVPHSQLTGGVRPSVVSLLLRTSGDPAALAPAVRTALREVDPGLVPGEVATLRERLLRNLSRPRLYALLVGAFAAAALGLAGIGLFGVLSYMVALRTREVGVRMALGARPGQVVALIARGGLRLALAGAAVGVLAALAAGSLLQGLLHGVAPVDATVATVVPLLVAAVATLACAGPAWRAARIDPQQALRTS